jgi:hypothetical protein
VETGTGFQLGILNVAGSLKGGQLGLINVNRAAWLPFLPFFNFAR